MSEAGHPSADAVLAALRLRLQAMLDEMVQPVGGGRLVVGVDAARPVEPSDAGPANSRECAPAAPVDPPGRAVPASALPHLPEAVRAQLSDFLGSGDEPARASPRRTVDTSEAAIAAAITSSTPPIPPSSSRASRWTPIAFPRLRDGSSELGRAVAMHERTFWAVGLFSLVLNVLMLAGPLFMLQVYDRVLASGSLPTLVALALLTAAAYAVIGLLDLVRGRIISRVGVDIDQRIGDRVFEASLQGSLEARGLPQQALRELDNLRGFIAGPGPATLFDVPWTPVYLLVIFLLHPWLGLASLIGAAVLAGLAMLGESRGRQPFAEAAKATAASLEIAESGQRNAEVILAMGMLGAYRRHWQQANRRALGWQVLATDRLGSVAAATKAARLALQSAMLAIGAVLALADQISAGAIVAASIVFGRALGPVEQLIAHWRSFVRAKAAVVTLGALLDKSPAEAPRTALPAPRGDLAVKGLRLASRQTRRLIVAGVDFIVMPGQVLAIAGPSASGKSTLARALVGLLEPISGSIELDGARLEQWSREALGRHVGYLPQDVELFAGTVRQNIARFRDDVSDAEVIEAARMAHAHEMILELPEGYDTELGPHGTRLSGGQRQRIALARALFGKPALVVLDEPNANLDRACEAALARAIDDMRGRRQTVILISHRMQAIGKADLLLVLEKGTQRAFGPREKVMASARSPATTPASAVPAAPEVSSEQSPRAGHGGAL